MAEVEKERVTMSPKKTMKKQFQSPNKWSAHWEIWPVVGDKIDVKADGASYKKGVLDLWYQGGNVGMFRDFRAAIQSAHCGNGVAQTWVNDGLVNHIVEANAKSWDITTGECIFVRHDLKDLDGNNGRLVAVFPHAAWWLERHVVGVE